jgi:hypothetical protein
MRGHLTCKGMSDVVNNKEWENTAVAMHQVGRCCVFGKEFLPSPLQKEEKGQFPILSPIR